MTEEAIFPFRVIFALISIGALALVIVVFIWLFIDLTIDVRGSAAERGAYYIANKLSNSIMTDSLAVFNRDMLALYNNSYEGPISHCGYCYGVTITDLVAEPEQVWKFGFLPLSDKSGKASINYPVSIHDESGVGIDVAEMNVVVYDETTEGCMPCVGEGMFKSVVIDCAVNDDTTTSNDCRDHKWFLKDICTDNFGSYWRPVTVDCDNVDIQDEPDGIYQRSIYDQWGGSTGWCKNEDDGGEDMTLTCTEKGSTLLASIRLVVIECNGDCRDNFGSYDKVSPHDVCQQKIGPEWYALTVDCEAIDVRDDPGGRFERSLNDEWSGSVGWCKDTDHEDMTVTCIEKPVDYDNDIKVFVLDCEEEYLESDNPEEEESEPDCRDTDLSPEVICKRFGEDYHALAVDCENIDLKDTENGIYKRTLTRIWNGGPSGWCTGTNNEDMTVTCIKDTFNLEFVGSLNAPVWKDRALHVKFDVGENELWAYHLTSDPSHINDNTCGNWEDDPDSFDGYCLILAHEEDGVLDWPPTDAGDECALTTAAPGSLISNTKSNLGEGLIDMSCDNVDNCCDILDQPFNDNPKAQCEECGCDSNLLDKDSEDDWMYEPKIEMLCDSSGYWNPCDSDENSGTVVTINSVTYRCIGGDWEIIS